MKGTQTRCTQPGARCVKRPARAAVMLLCAAALLVGAGCVYWRLYQFRRQLGDFAAHCEVLSDQPVLRFADPLLLPGDPEWLTGLAPTRIEEEADTLRQVYLLRKLRPPGDDGAEPTAFDLRIDLVYENGRLRDFIFPDRFQDWITEERLRKVFAADEGMEIERAERRTAWAMEGGADLPSLTSTLDLSGPPFRRDQTEAEVILVYRYRLEHPAGGPADAPPDAEGTLTFDRESETLRMAQLRAGRLHIGVTADPGGRYRITIERD